MKIFKEDKVNPFTAKGNISCSFDKAWYLYVWLKIILLKFEYCTIYIIILLNLRQINNYSWKRK